MVRCLLAEVVLHLLRRDGTMRTWYLGHFRHSPNAFWLTPPTPFGQTPFAPAGQTHFEHLHCWAKAHRSRPSQRNHTESPGVSFVSAFRRPILGTLRQQGCRAHGALRTGKRVYLA